jgi:hypothetical protein
MLRRGSEGMQIMQQKSNFFGGMSLQALQHRRRCEKLPALQNGEVENLVATFLASRSITQCPTRYAAPVEQRTLYGRGSN